MSMITPHFDDKEFGCPCGCKTNNINRNLVEMLEKVYNYFSNTERGITAIIITSGYRCPRHSVAVGGMIDDAHTKGIAADFYVLDKSGIKYGAPMIAAVCEYVGFSGIGVIDTMTCHADIRNATNYKNSHWFGDERTGNDNIKSWREYLPRVLTAEPLKEKHKIKIIYDNNIIFESEV